MALIGDVIISARSRIPDMPATLPVPSAAAAVVSSTGSTLPAGTYACIVTQRNAWGETLGATEITGLVVGANQGIQVTSALLPGAVAIRAYLTIPGGAAGSEIQYTEGTASPFTISTPLTAAGLPPARNTAWLPDTNGKRFSTDRVYQWLNEGLRRLSLKVGGIQDYSAVGSIVGQPLYMLTGEWRKITNAWYDGFPLSFGNPGGYFRRNTIQSSVLASCSISIRSNQVVIELFYQPVRTAGSSTLSVTMALTDTVASITSLTNFQSFGPPMFAQIGTEIVAFSAISGSQLINLIRGVGGTVAQAWPIGTAVKELNVPLLGKRLYTLPAVPGGSALLMGVPVGWDVILPDFIVAMVRGAEQDTQAQQALLKAFDEGAQEMLRANRQLAGPTQVGMGVYGADTVPGFGSSFGGVVLP